MGVIFLFNIGNLGLYLICGIAIVIGMLVLNLLFVYVFLKKIIKDAVCEALELDRKNNHSNCSK